MEKGSPICPSPGDSSSTGTGPPRHKGLPSTVGSPALSRRVLVGAEATGDGVCGHFSHPPKSWAVCRGGCEPHQPPGNSEAGTVGLPATGAWGPRALSSIAASESGVPTSQDPRYVCRIATNIFTLMSPSLALTECSARGSPSSKYFYLLTHFILTTRLSLHNPQEVTRHQGYTASKGLSSSGVGLGASSG